ncbi:phage N-6-adenine-methyltransferase [Luteibacter aegosomaticola]|uniref:phage N-6-adenine-methyltransferase n=1 Tax=Luteibacter aegosomaticola TaxID=2911538 RepID=UPI001FF87414|nr:phage N-6-adenine-methyltransferase [Luteibacter aegosomaticola]UPG88290.1 phage N-6-adenine-methyltransferase [Luteibacter aegosomaticola]
MTRSTLPAPRAAASQPATRRKPVSPKSSTKKGFQADRTVGEETWLTPRWLVDALDLPNVADVDPCAPPIRYWKTARRHFNKAQDGFNRVWMPEDFYWVNPPYGAECAKWMEKLADHGNGLLLVFARTDTRAFHDSVFAHPSTSAVFFFRGRLKFANAAGEEVGTAGAPSALVAYGTKAVGVIRRAIGRGEMDGYLLEMTR